MENVFVIALIFGILGIARPYQHRVLFWGILGVIVLRALMIGLGAVLVFIGAKIFLVGIVGKIPAVVSLSVTLGLIAGGVLYSLWKTRQDEAARGGPHRVM